MQQTNEDASCDDHRRIRLALIDDPYANGESDLMNYRDTHEDDSNKSNKKVDAS